MIMENGVTAGQLVLLNHEEKYAADSVLLRAK